MAVNKRLGDNEFAQLKDIDALLAAEGAPGARMQAVMDYLHARRPDYHWVGIYRLVGEELHLGPYQGPATDHQRIAVGRGVCGTAVAQNTNQIVDDVHDVDNYLACNLETRSEIVVLVRDPQDGGILGQIDVDGRRVRQFGASDEAFLTAVAERLAPLMR